MLNIGGAFANAIREALATPERPTPILFPKESLRIP
jgi:hypothetical protein